MKLIDLLEHHHCKKSLHRDVSKALRWFARVLERDPTTDDLTCENLESFSLNVIQAGLKKSTARVYTSHLRTLWRLAAAKGLMALPPDGRRYDESWRYDEPLTELENPPAGSLWEAFSVYAELHLMTHTREAWRLAALALRHFDHYLGRHATPGDLTDENVAGYEEWLCQRRVKRTAEGNVERLYALWKFAANAGYLDRLPSVKRKNRWYRDEDVLFE